MESSIYERERRDKVQKLRELGVDPFGGRTEGILPLADVRALHKPEFAQDGGPVVTVSGRVMFRKGFGKLTFMTLRDETGDLQVAIDKKRVPEKDWQANDLIDLGDRIVITGKLGATKTGEVTVWATVVAFASKALLPPPAKWEGLSDVELRYRQRYVDLWANPEVMRTLKLRMQIVDEVRTFLKGKGFLEVETPMMQALAGGAAARPFVTHHNALDIPLYMRIAPELYLKRLLVGGFTKVFELNRNFRNEGISPRHNPEFTMLEAYEAFGSWETMADLVEEMICTIAEKLFGGLKIEHKNADGTVRKTINLQRPWRRVRMVDLVAEWTRRYVGKELRFEKKDIRATAPEVIALLLRKDWRDFLNSFGGRLFDSPLIDVDDYGRLLGKICIALAAGKDKPDEISEDDWDLYSASWEVLGRLSPAEQLQQVYEKLIEPNLIDPTYVTHVPSVIIPLARKDVNDPFFADVYELAINGQEISPGYTELNDPDVQSENFTNQVGEDQQQIDHDFINALRYGMPPAGGMGLGIDRLVMMLTGAESIRDVILFPLMKPQDAQAIHAQEPANPT
ncbi:MAG: lysyl-tRNA synthetase [Phycisphaerales bacterium]|nr:lysyl-tRNA synthetase [Phycisphaerales bacterium]